MKFRLLVALVVFFGIGSTTGSANGDIIVYVPNSSLRNIYIADCDVSDPELTVGNVLGQVARYPLDSRIDCEDARQVLGMAGVVIENIPNNIVYVNVVINLPAREVRSIDFLNPTHRKYMESQEFLDRL